ncbi:CHAT domain-containing protein, partial [Streptomyces sp. NPDC002920]
LFCPVLSSSLQGLQQARHREERQNNATRVASKDVLAVLLPKTPGFSDLGCAVLELRALKKTFEDRLRDPLIGPLATRSAVMTELPATSIAHFACHGISNPSFPTRSSLMLFDHRNGPLTVGDLLDLNLPSARLAYLSACSTANSGLMVSEQAIHLASAFQVAGYPTVIGTLWSVSDAGAAVIANMVYSQVAENDIGSAHQALRSACEVSYRHNTGKPSLWAAYVCHAP